MHIGGLQKISLLDFPGHISAVVFTQGCPWRCQFCHNPALVDPERFCQPIDEQVVLDYLSSRVGRLDGVVISGGEPTLQADLLEFVGKVKAMGFAVKLDSSGVFPDRLSKILASGLIDYVAMDLKATWANYSQVIAVEVDPEALKRSMQIIRESGVAYEWRTTVVPGLPIDPVAISEQIQPQESYYLQAFRPSEDNLTVDLGGAPDPFVLGRYIQPISQRGVLVSLRS